MRPIFTRGVLAISGAILSLIGATVMAAPVLFLATSEIIVEHDASLISEVTAPSGLLIMTGALLVFGAIKRHLTRPALVLGAIVYCSYGLSRLASAHLHGMPSQTLITIAYFEMGVAALLAALAIGERHSDTA